MTNSGENHRQCGYSVDYFIVIIRTTTRITRIIIIIIIVIIVIVIGVVIESAELTDTFSEYKIFTL